MMGASDSNYLDELLDTAMHSAGNWRPEDNALTPAGKQYQKFLKWVAIYVVESALV